MTDLSHGASGLDGRLAEIDRQLRAIQVELDPTREPRPSRPPPAQKEPAHGRSGPLASLLEQSSARPVPPLESPPTHRAAGPTVPAEMHAKLLSAMRDLLDAYGGTLQQLPVAADPERAGNPPPVAVSVGPFANTSAVRAFEQELLRLPGVREVTLSGYEGENRAMYDVQLSEPNA